MTERDCSIIAKKVSNSSPGFRFKNELIGSGNARTILCIVLLDGPIEKKEEAALEIERYVEEQGDGYSFGNVWISNKSSTYYGGIIGPVYIGTVMTSIYRNDNYQTSAIYEDFQYVGEGNPVSTSGSYTSYDTCYGFNLGRLECMTLAVIGEDTVAGVTIRENADNYCAILLDGTIERKEEAIERIQIAADVSLDCNDHQTRRNTSFGPIQSVRADDTSPDTLIPRTYSFNKFQVSTPMPTVYVSPEPTATPILTPGPTLSPTSLTNLNKFEYVGDGSSVSSSGPTLYDDCYVGRLETLEDCAQVAVEAGDKSPGFAFKTSGGFIDCMIFLDGTKEKKEIIVEKLDEGATANGGFIDWCTIRGDTSFGRIMDVKETSSPPSVYRNKMFQQEKRKYLRA